MAGTLHGSVDHVSSGPNNASRNQELFTWLYNFFINQVIGNSYGTLIASSVGFWGAAGDGFGYWDSADPSRENAFFVVRMDTSTERPGGGVTGAYYIMVQWADSEVFGAAPGNPGKINNGTGDGVAVCAAFREDGTSPWAGTTNADGTDTKGATVWTAGGSTLHVLERSNSTGGGNAANKENMNRINDGNQVTRFHALCDEDFVVFLTDNGNDGNYKVVFIGPYDPSANLTVSFPMVFLSATLPLNLGNWRGRNWLLQRASLY